MKRSIYILTFLLGVFTCSSCESFLNMQPSNSANAGEAVTSVQEAQEIINGIMRAMSSSSYYGRWMLLYADAKGGDLTIYSAGCGEDALYVFSHTPTTGAYATFWETGYRLIAQVNNLLENIEKLEADGAQGYELTKGQALTLRALFHFDLVRLYGLPYNMDKSSYGIPVVTKTLNYDSKLTRNTVEETYRQVIADLTEGLNYLDASKNNRLLGYVDYHTNLAIQARVRLYMEDYEGAFQVAETLIKSELYKLYEPSEWVSSWTQQDYHESIFEIKMYPNKGGSGNQFAGVLLHAKKPPETRRRNLRSIGLFHGK
ncbi:MAG: RagB/SusD family nutrient uptake outer membrane protein [Bacteroides sp.]|nr:RagB/SusD family nutrient uptake outer membrane protein [Bacteroides sp.]